MKLLLKKILKVRFCGSVIQIAEIIFHYSSCAVKCLCTEPVNVDELYYLIFVLS